MNKKAPQKFPGGFFTPHSSLVSFFGVIGLGRNRF